VAKTEHAKALGRPHRVKMASDSPYIFALLGSQGIIECYYNSPVWAQPLDDVQEQLATHAVRLPCSAREEPVEAFVVDATSDIGLDQRLSHGVRTHRQDPPREHHPSIAEPRPRERRLNDFKRRQ
jgi:hypothetical protein